ncbi:STAS domain-containing protein [Singulisphaera rosea]
MPLSLIQDSGGIFSIRHEGEIRLGVFRTDVDPLDALLGQDCRSHVILLDLSRTTYIDSSGVAWLLKQHKRCNEAKGSLILHSVPPSVVSIFKLLHLEKFLKIADDEMSARELAKGGAH